MTELPNEHAEIWARLAEHFPAEAIKVLPQAVSAEQGKALGVPYVDARAVQDRLDAVLSPGNWEFSWQLVDAGQKAVKGTLMVRLGAELSRCPIREDVGYPNSETDDDPLKGAVSDALKRCAVLFGVGRYIYGLPKQWFECEFYPAEGSKKARFKRWKNEKTVHDAFTKGPTPAPQTSASAPPPPSQPETPAPPPPASVPTDVPGVQKGAAELNGKPASAGQIEHYKALIVEAEMVGLAAKGIPANATYEQVNALGLELKGLVGRKRDDLAAAAEAA